MYFEGAEDITFSKRNFKQVFADNPKLQEVFADVLFNHLSKFLSVTKSVSKQNNVALDNLNNIFAQRSNSNFAA